MFRGLRSSGQILNVVDLLEPLTQLGGHCTECSDYRISLKIVVVVVIHRVHCGGVWFVVSEEADSHT